MKKHLQLVRGLCLAASVDIVPASLPNSSFLLDPLMDKAAAFPQLPTPPQFAPDRPDPSCIVVSSSQSRRQRAKYRPANSSSGAQHHKSSETSAAASFFSSPASSTSNTPCPAVTSPQQQTRCHSSAAYTPTSASATAFSALQESVTANPRSSISPPTNVKRRHRRSSSAPNLPSPKTILSYATMPKSTFVTVFKPQFIRSHTVCVNPSATTMDAVAVETHMPAESPFSPRSSLYSSFNSFSTNLTSPDMEIGDGRGSSSVLSPTELSAREFRVPSVQCPSSPSVVPMNRSHSSPKSDMRRVVEDIQQALLRGTFFDASAAAGICVSFDSAIPAAAATNEVNAISFLGSVAPRKHIQSECQQQQPQTLKQHPQLVNYDGEGVGDNLSVIPTRSVNIPHELTVGEELAGNADWMAFEAAHHSRRKKSTVFTFEYNKKPVTTKERR